MNKTIIAVIGAAVLLLGQLLLFSEKYIGIAVSLFAVIVLAAAVVDFRKVPLKQAWRGLCILMFVICAALGMFFALSADRLGVVFFFVSAVFLVLTMINNKQLMDLTGLPSEPRTVEKWEKYFLIGLVVILFFTLMFMPSQFPAGFTGHESEMAAEVPKMEREYTAHSFAGDVSFPSLIFYQGLFFTKIFGYETGSFRIPSGIWGIIGVISFYFLARLLFSPKSAAFAALLFAASNLHIVQSRWFFAGTILIPPLLAGFAFIVYGLRYKKWYLFLLGGLAAGFSIHGYFPGRGAPLVFLAWFAMSMVFWRKYSLKLSHVALFLAGMIIVSSPVIGFAIKYPGHYFGYFDHANPNKAGGITRYIETLKEVLPIYAKMFHYRSDGDYSIHIEYAPLLDKVTGAFFPPAFFLCLLLFFRPIPAFILLVFFAGMFPAFLGGAGFAHPTERRVIMALPGIYLFAAFAFELFKRAVIPDDKKVLGKVFFTAAIIAAVTAVGMTSYNYFFRYAGSPYEALGYGRMYKEAGEFLKKNADSKRYLSPRFKNDVAAYMLVPGDADIIRTYNFEDVLKSDSNSDVAFVADGYFANAKGIFNKLYRNVLFTISEDSDCNMPIVNTETFRRKTEPYRDCSYAVKIMIPQKDIVDSIGLERVVKDGKDTLSGTFFSNSDTVTVVKPAGSVVYIDSIKRQGAGPFKITQGANLIEVHGAKAGEIEVFEQGARLQIMKITEPYGLKSCHVPGYDSWGNSCVYSRNDLFAIKRFHDGAGYNAPSSVTYSGYLRVDRDGGYILKSRELMARTEISVAGVAVSSNLKTGMHDFVKSVELKAGVKYPFAAKYVLEGGEGYRAFVIEYKLSGQKDADYDIVPAEWFLRF